MEQSIPGRTSNGQPRWCLDEKLSTSHHCISVSRLSETICDDGAHTRFTLQTLRRFPDKDRRRPEVQVATKQHSSELARSMTFRSTVLTSAEVSSKPHSASLKQTSPKPKISPYCIRHTLNADIQRVLSVVDRLSSCPARLLSSYCPCLQDRVWGLVLYYLRLDHFKP